MAGLATGWRFSAIFCPIMNSLPPLIEFELRRVTAIFPYNSVSVGTGATTMLGEALMSLVSTPPNMTRA